MLKKLILILGLALLLTAALTTPLKAANPWATETTFTISRNEVPVYTKPTDKSNRVFSIYRGTELNPLQTVVANGYKWFEVEMGRRKYWVPAVEPQGIVNVLPGSSRTTTINGHIIDAYGILEKEHRYAVKLVKFEDNDPKWGAEGRLETYRKTESGYELQYTYPVKYPKDGPKNRYGDLKTVGGNVVRYLYRTTRSGMNGWNNNWEKFGVYKVSFPMPHDALPFLEQGQMSLGQYNNIRSLNQYSNGQYYPHPGSMLGADIVIHTARKGSLGCIILENESMSFMYHKDLVTENNTEIIPFIIYDEHVAAPPVGQLL